jgi:transcriptional regulator with PAS, ATPase and Fis domain
MTDNGDDERLIGTSQAIREVETELDDAARSDAKVLITGESGVGKEVVARLIHQRSPRRQARLLIINCAGLPDSLLESELFGHVRGAFTGAYRDKTGLLELAHRGTVMMDEVGEMSLRMQAVLLRFLETGEVHRVGADRAQARVDVRVLAATNRNLPERITSGDFRQDLFFRLNVIQISVPPIRERREDIPPLLQHFLAVYAERGQVPVPELAPAALARLVNYDWPGNVRELKNVAQRITLRKHTGLVTPAGLVPELPPAPAPNRAEQSSVRFAETLFDRVTGGQESFWTAVYEPFMSRDITRDDMRAVIGMGLEQAQGSYRLLLDLFRMPATDYKRFLNFLRTYECQVPKPHAQSMTLPSQAPRVAERTAPASAWAPSRFPSSSKRAVAD